MPARTGFCLQLQFDRNLRKQRDLFRVTSFLSAYIPCPRQRWGVLTAFPPKNLKIKRNLLCSLAFESYAVEHMPQVTHPLVCNARVHHTPAVALQLRDPNAADTVAAFKTSLFDGIFPIWDLSPPSLCPPRLHALRVPQLLNQRCLRWQC